MDNDVYLRFDEFTPKMKKKIEKRASQILAKKAAILGKQESRVIKGQGQKPLFGAKPGQKSVFVYGSSQNPANVPFLFSSLPTTERRACKPHPVQIEPGVWRFVKSNADTRSSIGNVVEYWTQEAPRNAFYFFGNHRKLIFAKERSGEKKSLYVETQWNVPDAIDKREWDMIVEQAFDEAMTEIYGE